MRGVAFSVYSCIMQFDTKEVCMRAMTSHKAGRMVLLVVIISLLSAGYVGLVKEDGFWTAVATFWVVLAAGYGTLLLFCGKK